MFDYDTLQQLGQAIDWLVENGQGLYYFAKTVNVIAPKTLKSESSKTKKKREETAATQQMVTSRKAKRNMKRKSKQKNRQA